MENLLKGQWAEIVVVQMQKVPGRMVFQKVLYIVGVEAVQIELKVLKHIAEMPTRFVAELVGLVVIVVVEEVEIVMQDKLKILEVVVGLVLDRLALVLDVVLLSVVVPSSWPRNYQRSIYCIFRGSRIPCLPFLNL